MFKALFPILFISQICLAGAVPTLDPSTLLVEKVMAPLATIGGNPPPVTRCLCSCIDENFTRFCPEPWTLSTTIGWYCRTAGGAVDFWVEYLNLAKEENCLDVEKFYQDLDGVCDGYPKPDPQVLNPLINQYESSATLSCHALKP